MENKYYTPDISEFYVGFEYEHCHSSVRFVMLNFKTGDTSNIGETKEIWEKSIFSGREYDIWESSFKFDDSLKNGQIRVKYLDKEDIESLGFSTGSYQEMDDAGIYNFYSDSSTMPIYVIIYNENSHLISIEKIDERYLCNPKLHKLFRGHIKNKSELKKVLKMIGYESEQRN